MVGSQGAGETLVACAMPCILLLPEMSIEESLYVTHIYFYSTADQLFADTSLIRHHSFHAPHHTISHADLVGGGTSPSRMKYPLRIAAFYF